jgi:hypothetical protein
MRLWLMAGLRAQCIVDHAVAPALPLMGRLHDLAQQLLVQQAFLSWMSVAVSA